ncbi:hypothetical protein VN12_06280 [Pirellula sp. SH-Sr6A]|uniref:hypothetical protein n=1 Tax=Pirellula sp. SH-Sr6A TaxID=1632865 RepID=UPI00078D5025|nr:hypothetical protein [Pirellula sp. SH-Sr6A]AMV31709.1 hypothetical protein VN12_06280 [Pirellula sp. SH-Sr6A]
MDEDAIHEPIALLHSLVPEVHRRIAGGIIDRFPRGGNFYSFIRRYHSVIGKDLRNQRGIEDCKDVLSELEFAALTANFFASLQYQVSTPTGKKIDFLAEFEQTGHVGIEVKRIREIPEPTSYNEEDQIHEINYSQKESFKFTGNIMAAMHQLMPDVPNVIYVKIESTVHEFYDAAVALNAIVQRVRNKDIDFLRKHKFDSTAQFLDHYQRMNLLVVRSKWGQSISSTGTDFNSNRIWRNEEAAIGLPENVVDIFRRGENWG